MDRGPQGRNQGSQEEERPEPAGRQRRDRGDAATKRHQASGNPAVAWSPAQLLMVILGSIAHSSRSDNHEHSFPLDRGK